MNTEPTVEEVLVELKATFPLYKYFSIQYHEGAPQARVKVIAMESYYSSKVQFANGETLSEAMAQIRQMAQGKRTVTKELSTNG